MRRKSLSVIERNKPIFNEIKAVKTDATEGSQPFGSPFGDTVWAPKRLGFLLM